jgi:hypothetical protein
MTRKDSEKDTDRPHYYSQFWLDVAAGRTVISAPKVEEEEELAEADLEMLEPEPTPLRKAGRSTASVSDGYKSTRAHTVVEPAFAPDEFVEPEENEFEQELEVNDLELPNIDLEETEEETIIPQPDLILEEAETEEETIIPQPDLILEEAETEEGEEEEEEEELFYDEEEEEEEEEEDSWGARGRKKPKPGRQVKAPKPSKKPKREIRRGF